MRRLCLIAVVAVATCAPRALHAEVERYALIVGNNIGDSEEPRLVYAEDDARRLHDVLHELGGFRAENIVLLRSQSAETVRRSLIALNDRIRTQTAAGAQSELVVYYSGHSDQSALHLGRSALELIELEQLVRGSSATLRVLILDSCRSGALTRVKGGTIQPGFAIALDQRVPNDGVVFWTATSESENAQESDAVRGSFFTHYLVSGLVGAADLDGNGSVTLGEAYQYSYENTLRATSRTLNGTQHPTFRYELGGHGEMVLTTLRGDGQRALVSFPYGTSYLVFEDSEDGAVVAEVSAHGRTRRLSVKPGRYFVRGRSAEFLLEGTLVVRPAEQRQVREQDLDRIEYARLVRKGGNDRTRTDSVVTGYSLRTSLWRGGTLCQGPFAGYAIDLRYLSLAPRVGICRGGFEAAPSVNMDELDVELRGAHAWDIGRISVSTGGTVGGSYLRQRAGNAAGVAGDGVAHVGVSTGATVNLPHGFYSGVEVDALAYFRVLAPLSSASSGTEMMWVSTPYVLRLNMLLIGKHW
jgi:hypothetical protein